jgi:hypothetical protein
MALDVTRSMSGGLRPSLCPTPNEQGTLEIINTKLGALRCALRTLISELSSYVTADTRDKMRVSVIPFDVRVNVGQEQFRDAAWINWQMGNRLGWRGCIGYREKSWRRVITDPVAKKYGYVDFAPECTVPELVPLRDIWTVENRESLMYAISRFTSGPGSLLNPGLLWSWHMLSREGSAPIFNVARTKTEMENQKGRKVVVLFSDGWNNQGEMFPGANYWVLPGADRLRDTNEDMEAICTNIKNDGIEIYVVAFDNNNSVERARLARCASPGPQYFISASSAQQLIEAFRNVAVSFRPVRLTK